MIHRVAWCLASFFVAAASVSSTHASTTGEVEPRRLGPTPATIDGSLVGDGEGAEGDAFVVALAVGDGLFVEVEQLGVDRHVVLDDPTGRRLLDVDSHTGNLSVERLIAVAATAGDHRLKVVPFAGERGDYRLDMRAIEPASGSIHAMSRRCWWSCNIRAMIWPFSAAVSA